MEPDAPAPLPDWVALRAAATRIAERAYAPYSGFFVGAAALVADGRIVTGANVENTSYGLTMCAENAVVAALVASGGGALVAIAVVGNGRGVTPCGRCRQLLWEFGGPGCLVDVDGSPTRLATLLPAAFPDHSPFQNPPRHQPDLPWTT
jgi:cytidine deaminase